MTRSEPKLQTTDDRLARIEDLVIKANTKLDRLEQALSRLELDVRQQRKK